MTIKKVLDGCKVNLLAVNIVKQINEAQFIVSDNSGAAVINVQNSEIVKQFKVGKGLKIFKPQTNK